ncbi:MULTISPECIES: GNAT family N-acetyltransferase [unclassified Agarivorans]|uniref:GNAT family N-acetyltransferase n=1 Tax=unclassified Agarivorans TaxID=2636026 RepID=UPI003D7DF2B5
MAVQVIMADLAQLEAVAELFDQYRVFYKQNSDLNLARDFIAERMRLQQSVIFVALSAEGRALGFTQLYPSFSSTNAARIWILNDLFVTPAARGQGIAPQLMNAAKQHALATQAVALELATATDNHRAQALYQSLAYQVDREFIHYHLPLEPVQ